MNILHILSANIFDILTVSWEYFYRVWDIVEYSKCESLTIVCNANKLCVYDRSDFPSTSSLYHYYVPSYFEQLATIINIMYISYHHPVQCMF